jgi:hypothetical protein
MSTSPTISTSLNVNGTETITSSSENALSVGANGATNPVLNVNANTASVATGINIVGAAAAGGVQLNAISSGTNEQFDINALGTSSLRLNPTGTGTVNMRGGSLSVTSNASNFAPSATNTASTTKFTYTNPNESASSLTAGAEAVQVLFNLGANARRHSGNTAIPTQRDFIINAPTHSFATAGGVITDASTLYIGGAPIAGTNASITNPWALNINGGNVKISTITSGTWNGSVIGSSYGGAGTVNGILKANGSGTVSAATSGTDYAPATSGSSILYGNGSGGFSNVTIGSGLSFSTGTLSATGGGTGDVVGPASATDTAIALFDGTTGKLIKNSTVTINGSGDISTGGDLGVGTVSAGTVNANNSTLQNLVVGDYGLVLKDNADANSLFVDIPSLGGVDRSLTLDMNSGNRTVSLAANLTIPADPNADRILFWDDSAGATTWLTLGTNLSITGTTIDAAGGSGSPAGSTGYVQYNTSGAFDAEAAFAYDASTNKLTVGGIAYDWGSFSNGREYINYKSASSLSFFNVIETNTYSNAVRMQLGYSEGAISTVNGTGKIYFEKGGYAGAVIVAKGGIEIPSFGSTGYWFPSTDGPILNINPTLTTIYENTTNAFIARFGVTDLTGNIAGRTLTNAATVRIDGAPTQGVNQTITNRYALWVAGGTSKFDGVVTVPDDAYDATTWNGNLEVPTKNAIRDKIESMSAAGGITRTIVTTSGSITMGSSAATDYIYFVPAAHTLSLPAAAANTNRYTVKNNHSASITVDTVGAETIDGAASVSIPAGSSRDFASDGTNWGIL